MPGFRNPHLEEAKRLNSMASALFDQGTTARDTANDYVRDAVLLATVLFLIAIAQRFTVRGARIGAGATAVALLLFTLVSFVSLPPGADEAGSTGGHEGH